MVCHRNQFGYRLFFLPPPADIFSSVFHSLNSIKKSARCYFKLRHLSLSFFLAIHIFKLGSARQVFFVYSLVKPELMVQEKRGLKVLLIQALASVGQKKKK